MEGHMYVIKDIIAMHIREFVRTHVVVRNDCSEILRQWK
jgi:hypothetical protein